jgi:hypothetical protein
MMAILCHIFPEHVPLLKTEFVSERIISVAKLSRFLAIDPGSKKNNKSYLLWLMSEEELFFPQFICTSRRFKLA